MNHYDAIQIRSRAARGQPVDPQSLAEANAYVTRQRNPESAHAPAATAAPAPRYIEAAAPPFSALCECGARYGMHRFGDRACPNQKWRTGNGESQWLGRKWQRAAS